MGKAKLSIWSRIHPYRCWCSQDKQPKDHTNYRSSY